MNPYQMFDISFDTNAMKHQRIRNLNHFARFIDIITVILVLSPIKSQSEQTNDFQNKSAVIHPIKLWLCSYFDPYNQLTYITKFFYFNLHLRYYFYHAFFPNILVMV